MPGAGRLGELGRGGLEGTAQTRRARSQVRQGVEEASQALVRRRVRVQRRVEPRPEPLIGAVEVGDDEVLLRREVPVHRGLRDPCTRHDQVDADRVEAALVEQRVGGGEKALPP